jgi:hypothetical protein
VAELSEGELHTLIEDATVDAYDDDEQLAAILDVPLPTPTPADAEWISAYRRCAS